MPAPKRHTADQLADMRSSYEDTTEPMWSIAHRHAMNERTLGRLARREGWRMRASRLDDRWQPAAASPALAAEAAIPWQVPDTGIVPGEDEPLAERLERMIEQQLAAVTCALPGLATTPAHLGAAERSVRTLASLARALRQLRQVKNAEKPAAAKPDTRDYDQLRLDVAAMIERLAGEETNPLPDEE